MNHLAARDSFCAGLSQPPLLNHARKWEGVDGVVDDGGAEDAAAAAVADADSDAVVAVAVAAAAAVAASSAVVSTPRL